MPGLPRRRALRARVLRAQRIAADVLVIGALCALWFVVLGLAIPVALSLIATTVAVGWCARRIARDRNALAALGEEIGGGVVVESEGGEHGTIVAGRQNREEADR